ncbi:MAG TPA: NRDE family protein [Nevskiaceae bacterium]
MCVIAFAWHAHPSYPLVAIANRDEAYARPTRPLGQWPEDPAILGGRDLQAGGAWLGAGPAGRFAAVTNIRLRHALIGERSRGDLVRHFLLARESPASAAATAACEADRYGPFNLLLADHEELAWATSHPVPLWHSVPRGVHGVSNGPPSFGDGPPWPKVARVVHALARWLDALPEVGGAPDITPLFDALMDEAPVADGELPDTGVAREVERRLARVFVRGERYGTRCSSVVLIDRSGRATFHERRFTAGGVFQGATRAAHPAAPRSRSAEA